VIFSKTRQRVFVKSRKIWTIDNGWRFSGERSDPLVTLVSQGVDVKKVCKKHREKPAIMYGQCIGCELDGLRKQVDDMKYALKVLHTWASFDVSEGQQTALVPEHVVSLCDKALGRGKRES